MLSLQDELRKFIKFACNQERIPFGLPCRDGQDVDMNVPPYPMKIAPPDGRGKGSCMSCYTCWGRYYLRVKLWS